MANDTHNASPGPDRRIISIAEVVAGYVTAIVVLVYPIGLLTFAAQLWTAYGYAPSKSLYAASLAPTAIVAAKVFHAAFWFSNAIAAVEMIKRWGVDERVLRRRWVAVIILILLIIPLTTAIPFIASLFGPTYLATTRGLLLYGMFIVSVFLGGLLSRALRSAAKEGIGWRRQLLAQVSAYLLTILAAIFLASTEGPSLPQIVLETEPGIEVNLLSHSEGYWYVFDDELGELSAIPDDEAGRVSFHKSESEWVVGL